MTIMLFAWGTTLPHPTKKAHRHGADDGQVGWKLHAFPVEEDGTHEKRAQSLCGLRPRHGWGLDLFIDERCTRCDAIMDRREKAGDDFIDIPAKLSKERQDREIAEFLAQEKAEGRN